MKQANIIYLVFLLGQSVAIPTDSTVFPRDIGLKDSGTIVQARDDIGICPFPNLFEPIGNFFGSLPPDWQSAFAGASFFGGSTGLAAKGFCDYALAADESSSTGCTGLGFGVGGLVFTAFAGFIIYRNGAGRLGSVNQDLSGGAVKRGELLAEQMESALRARGVEFDDIFTTPLTTRDSTSGYTLDILGVRSPNQEIVMDHKLNLRDDGTGVARATISSLSSGHTLTRREIGPGVKVSYNFVKAEDKARKVEESDLQTCGQNIGQDWENRVNTHDNYVRYFGTAKLGLDYTVNFQIIPERGNFNNAYEDVNVCHIFG
ncbi:hypothetical protein K449DRAFT_115518 [Hypoxylon sp. EC38]|nr:hypothetical protein K449DRAFT_115518 [Hypoxylon sp. EC38]